MVGNWVDLIFIATLLYFVLTNNGFIRTMIELAGFLFALLLSYRLYNPLGSFIASYFSLPRGYAAVIGFFFVWFIAELLFFFVIYFFLKNLVLKARNSPPDIALGFLVGAVQGMFIFLFFISLIFGLPVRGEVKQQVLSSQTGPVFVNLAQSFESKIKEVFGGAAAETLNFLTIKPQSGEVLQLGFTVDRQKISYDPSSETTMFQLVNTERVRVGIPPLGSDERLRDIARSYAVQMLQYGFFSHISPVDHSDVSIRANVAGVSYGVIGENLAFAPDAYIAHQGLMNSPGHRENILSPDYKKIGVGITDAGLYGKMFVQIFTD